MRKNWLTTVGGIMALFGAIPIALGTAHVAMPSWFYVICISFGVIGPGVVGIAAKGQDEHSTPDQIQNAQAPAQKQPQPPASLPPQP